MHSQSIIHVHVHIHVFPMYYPTCIEYTDWMTGDNDEMIGVIFEPFQEWHESGQSVLPGQTNCLHWTRNTHHTSAHLTHTHTVNQCSVQCG